MGSAIEFLEYFKIHNIVPEWACQRFSLLAGLVSDGSSAQIDVRPRWLPRLMLTCLPARLLRRLWTFPRRQDSLRLEIDESTPVFILSPFGTSFLLPQDVGPLPQTLVERAMPVLFCTPIRASVFLPQQVSTFPDNLV
jgi:hypothetical protein